MYFDTSLRIVMSASYDVFHAIIIFRQYILRGVSVSLAGFDVNLLGFFQSLGVC